MPSAFFCAALTLIRRVAVSRRAATSKQVQAQGQQRCGVVGWKMPTDTSLTALTATPI